MDLVYQYGMIANLPNSMHGFVMSEEGFVSRAIELARQGMRRGDGGPFGTVVVRDVPSSGLCGEEALALAAEYAAMPGRRIY